MAGRSRERRLPLFRRPGRVAVLDDDVTFLQMLFTVLGRAWDVETFSNPREFEEALLCEVPFTEADAWSQQDLVEQWRIGATSLPAAVVRYLARSTERFGLTSICVVDLRLEDRLGTDVLRSMKRHGWGGHAVLLTASSGLETAVAAFNEGLISRYEIKHGGHVLDRLGHAVAELQESGNQRLDQIWRSTMSTEQDAALRSPQVYDTLGPYLRERMTEYVVIGQPFGVLGVTAAGEVAWLSLQLAGSGAALRDLRDELELAKPMSAASVPVSFGDETGVYGQFFKTDEQLTAHPLGFDQWRGRAHGGAVIACVGLAHP